MGPAYHPDWLVTFWLSTPVLNQINPHYVLVLVALVVIIYYFLKRKQDVQTEELDGEDQAFKHLLQRKRVIEEQMGLLEQKLEMAEISEADFSRKHTEYNSHLEQVKTKLKEYTL